MLGGLKVDIKIEKRDMLFLLICLGLGLLAELTFLHGTIGIAYPVFILGFYIVLFLKFRLRFHHRRIGLLFMAAIWMLSMSFVLYDNFLFYQLNILLIPILVLAHIVLITSPNTYEWNTPKFILLVAAKLGRGIEYSASFVKAALKKAGKTEEGWKTWRLVFIGILISTPLLVVILSLLMSADAVFNDMMSRFFPYIFEFTWVEDAFRIVYVILAGMLFFGVFQVLTKQSRLIKAEPVEKKVHEWSSVIAITILVMLNAVFVLFVAIQFTYFFNENLIEGFTYADYARRGFFELVFVTMINFSLLILFLKLVVTPKKGEKLTLKILYSLLVVVSGIMLISAYQRLSLYEEAYGFTFDRLLARTFMIFLIVIFAYTFIRIWLERLSLIHFYLILGLFYYAFLNVIHLDQIVVNKNLERYEEVGKIDIYYLESQSYTGIDGLMRLYEKNPDYPELKQLLQRIELEELPNWQSYNITKHKVTKKFNEMTFE